MANPDDFTLISIIGSNLFSNGVGLLVTTIPYGIYVVLFFFAVIILCRDGVKPQPKIALLLAVFSMFAISTFFVATYAHIFLETIRIVLVNGVTEPVANKIISYQDRFTFLSLIQEVLFFVEVLIGDFVVVWRAWALWSENRKIVLIPIALLLGSAASAASFFGCFVHYNWPLDMPPTCNALNISTYVLSMATNVASTTAIGYKVWVQRSAFKRYFATSRHGLGMEKILVLLMESGMVYTTLWILQLITCIPSIGNTYSGQLVQQVFNSISVQIVGIYPTLTIVLVFLHRSLWDASGSALHLERPPAPLSSGVGTKSFDLEMITNRHSVLRRH
ncbi:hypothetical protein PM082_019070 [Marasmius tenuissimus]|nr:hypothetical protein PM082_019070 [Marasmius tenuissimus]